MFVRRIEGEIEGLICLWIDDKVVCGADKNFCSLFENNISEKIEISEISDLEWFLGMKIDYSGNEIRMSQEKYVEKLISRFRMTEARPITFPFGENEKLTKKDCPLEGSIEQENIKKTCDYRGLVGCLNYLALSSRPDICFAANLLSFFVEKHWKAGKNCLRYLLGTKSLPLVYKRDKDSNLVSYSDADWAGNIDNRRSTPGYCFKFSDKSGVISWSSRLQRCVSASTAEEEHNAVVETVKEGIHLQGILSDLGIICNRPLEVFVDNQACIALSKHSRNHGKTKQFAIKLHFLQELIEQEKVTLTFLATANMPADALTKNLGRCKLHFSETCY